MFSCSDDIASIVIRVNAGTHREGAKGQLQSRRTRSYAPALYSHNPEPQIASARIWRVRRPSTNPIAIAVGIVTKVRTTTYHPRRPAAGALRIISGNPPGIPMKRRRKPVRTPLPNVASNVVKTKLIGQIARNRRSAMPPVFERVRVRKLALPYVAHVPTIRFQLLAPNKSRLIQTTTSRILLLRLCRQP